MKKIAELATSKPPAPEGEGEDEETTPDEDGEPTDKFTLFEQLCAQLETLGLDILTSGDEGAVDKVHEKLMQLAQAITNAADEVTEK